MKKTRTSEQVIEQINQLHKNGLSAYEISKKLKINYSVANYHVNKGKKPHNKSTFDLNDFEKYKRQNEYLMKKNKFLEDQILEQMN